MKQIPKTYEPKKYEDKIYRAWEKSGFFNPDKLKLPKNAKSYTIVLPPPNITDKLHLGHSSMLAIEDLLIRFHRMKGYRALWVPGTDHAAIATQNVVEKKLLREKNLRRQDLGKEKFLKEVWKFLKTTQATILHQTRKMGASLDWSREAFTFDEKRKKAVARMFCDMYREGVIYRGERIVNWCPRCHSTLADDELEYQEQKTKLYTFRYDKNFPISIATTRPETKLGDTAVAVNPNDKRYTKLVGKTIEADFLGIKLKIKIISDRNVDKDFGTGALGVTPAHSMVDWKMAEDNGLEIVKVIDEDGKIRQGFGKFSGKTSAEAREMIAEELEKQGLLEKDEEMENNLSVCYRCGTAIEPLPSKQWFVAVDKKIKRLGNKSLKEKALEVAEKKKTRLPARQVKFIPFRFTKRYTDWMENLHDWCISRQIWFGHEIPVWYRTSPPTPLLGKERGGGEIYVGEKSPKGEGWKQDPDTLDTWFSSGMWTFSTLDWPNTLKGGRKSGDLKEFHPTQVLETGYEIITLWVSRMIMMSLFAVGEIPFENVYLHGLVLDKNGKKMSKSKGNGIDPLDMIEKFGTDAVRLSLLIGSTPGNDMRMGEEKIASFRNFVTKLWNIHRFCESSGVFLTSDVRKSDLKSLSDCWIVSRVNTLCAEVTKDLEEYKFSLAGEKLENFTWGELADWYLEISKIEKNSKVLGYVLDKVLRLWHPFAPFVTEKIWIDLNKKRPASSADRMLMVAKWPLGDKKLVDKRAEREFRNLQEMISKIRNLRASYKIEPNKIIKAYAKNTKHKEIIEKLARVEIFTAQSTGKVIMLPNIRLDIADVIDVKKEKEKIRESINILENNIKKNKGLIENKHFIKKAPQQVIQRTMAAIYYSEQKLKEQKELLGNLG